jgi:type IV pilus assembly protein PilA
MSIRKQRHQGFSLIELLIVIAIILIIITIAVPKYNSVQRYMRETAAIKAIQTIHQVETQYQSQYGRYAASLAELGPPASGAPSPAAADLISNDLAQGTKQGYKFTVTAIPGGYQVNANPEVYGTSGSRSFYSDQTMVIHENYGPEPATVSSKELGVGDAGSGAGGSASPAPAKQ